MFKRIILWSEFPEETDWKKAVRLIDFKVEVYIAVRSKRQFQEYTKKIRSKNIILGAWPALSKEEGYWFSGLTSKESIDELRQYKGMRIKIDLEPPIPKFKHNNLKTLLWGLGIFFKNAKNTEYLKETIYWLAKNNTKILINEAPMPKFYLNKLGITLEKRKNMTLQLMMYTTLAGQTLRPLCKNYNKIMLKRIVKQNPDMSASVGLIGPGILEKEGCYTSPEQFRQDLEMLKSAGISNVAVYSLDAILKRDNPKEWIDVLKDFT
ncbi:hypothetical protein FJZ53_03275 [Candidatus Woesearchaeota archaeon]|nr:hypothetical protein [Candidatus Woesearchaeota archaeon]